MVGERGSVRTQRFQSISLTSSFSTLVRAGQLAPKGQSFIRPTAANIGPLNAAALNIRWNASSSATEITVGPWALAARSSLTCGKSVRLSAEQVMKKVLLRLLLLSL